MDLAWEDWALIGVTALAAVLVVIGLVMVYGPRTTYNVPSVRGVAEAEQHITGRHHQQDGYSTARLGPFPPRTVHPKDLK